MKIKDQGEIVRR